MKTILLKKLTIVVALFATITMTAQQGPTLYDFSGGAQSWVKGYGAGVVAHDANEGAAADGALTLDRLQTNNNANIRRGQGGDDAFVVIDRAVYNFVKIVYKNELAATNMRIQGQSRVPGMATANFPNILVSGITNLTSQTSSEFTTVVVDLSAIPANTEVTRLDILVRGDAANDPAGALMIFDSIEFLETAPDTNTYSEFIQNPDFEDPMNYIGNQAVATRELTTAEFQNGAQSFLHTFVADAAGPTWAFASYEQEYDAGAITATYVATVTMWVKSSRSTPARIIIRLKTTNAAGTNIIEFPTGLQTTSGVADTWEELTFTMPITFDGTDPATEVRGINLFFGVDYDATDTALNAVTGDKFYYDNMSASLADNGTLSVGQNVLEGVSIYPNPSQGSLNIASPDGGEIVIYNVLGAMVKSEKALSKNYAMKVSDLKSGMYILNLTSEGKTANKKLIIE